MPAPAWLRSGADAPLQLMPGDVLLLPSGAPHRLSSTPTGHCVPFDRVAKEQLLTPEGDLALGGDGATTTFVCAGYAYDIDVADTLMGLLPQVLHLPADPRRHRDVAAIVELLAGEVGARRPGSWAAAGRLLDTLLIAAIRHWAELQDDTDVRGWLPALRDPHRLRPRLSASSRPQAERAASYEAAAKSVTRLVVEIGGCLSNHAARGFFGPRRLQVDR